MFSSRAGSPCHNSLASPPTPGKLAAPVYFALAAYNALESFAGANAMPNRDFYLAAYDVTDPERLQAALHVLKGYACGGQKSVFECFLTVRERGALLAEVRGVLDTREDRFMLLPLPGHRDIRGLGLSLIHI